ncbi:MAG: hypothetical protein D9V47_08945 [Clostridia bacterium]|nr:MAG: hypothetical protein D9V47_08945 [Clostridia bacterium]
MTSRKGLVRLSSIILLATLLPLAVWPASSQSLAATPGELQEIMLLEVRLQEARHHLAELNAGVVELEGQVQAARRETGALQAGLIGQRQQLQKWLIFTYRHGFMSYMEVLVGASSYADFISRWYLLTALLNYGTKLVKDTAATVAELQEKQAEVEARLQAIVEKRREAQKTLAGIEDLLEQKQAALARAEARGDQATTEMARSWENELPDLQYLLSHFSQLPWQSVEPDAAQVDYQHLRVLATVTAASLTRAMATDAHLARMELEITPEGVTIRGHAPDFALTGQVSALDNRVYLNPFRLVFAGVDVGPEVMAAIVADYQLYFAFPQVFPGLRLESIRQGQGYFLLTLTFQGADSRAGDQSFITPTIPFPGKNRTKLKLAIGRVSEES